MNGSVPRGTRWELVSHDDGTERWTWRQMGVDDAVMQASEPHASFGKAIHDALVHGFSPAVDHWIIKSGGWVTHFTSGNSPITITPDDHVIQRPVDARGDSPKSGAGTVVDGGAPPPRTDEPQR